MSSQPHRIGRFELSHVLDETHHTRFEHGIDSATGEQVVVESVANVEPIAGALIDNARASDRFRLAPRARLLTAGVDGDLAYAAYRVPAGARSLNDVLDEHQGRVLSLAQRVTLLESIVDVVRRSIQVGSPCLAIGLDTIWVSPSLDVDIIGVVPISESSATGLDRCTRENRRLIDVYGALIAGVLAQSGGNAAGGSGLDPEAEERIAALGSHFPAGDEPLDLDRFAASIAEVIALLLPSRVSETQPPVSREMPVTKEPLAGVQPTSPDRPLAYDENVQFTVYRPRTLTPGKWQSLLAFAHLAERRPGAPEDEPDPLSEVARQAQALLHDPASYRHSTEDSSHAIPRDGEISFIPMVAGVEFNPPSVSFRWTESVHRADFRMRAAGVTARTVQGRMSVYLGALLLAEINLSLPVGGSDTVAPVAVSARPYRRIFASYSHKDQAIVAQYRDYAKGLGDRYLQDVYDLRSGERWLPALEQLIRDADVFQLFWSWHALESPYVQHEWRFALGLSRPSFVRPVYWDDPLPARDGLPPKELTDLQFARIATAATNGGMAPPSRSTTPAPPSAQPGPIPAPAPRRVDAGIPSHVPPAPAPVPRSETVTLGAEPAKRTYSWPLLSAVAGLALVAVLAPMLYRSAQPQSGAAAPPPSVSETITTTTLDVEVSNAATLSPQALSNVVIRLLDPGTGNVVASAPVSVEGVAKFDAVSPGTYLIEAPGPGTEVAARPTVTISEGTPARAAVVLQAR